MPAVIIEKPCSVKVKLVLFMTTKWQCLMCKPGQCEHGQMLYNKREYLLINRDNFC